AIQNCRNKQQATGGRQRPTAQFDFRRYSFRLRSVAVPGFHCLLPVPPDEKLPDLAGLASWRFTSAPRPTRHLSRAPGAVNRLGCPRLILTRGASGLRRRADESKSRPSPRGGGAALARLR